MTTWSVGVAGAAALLVASAAAQTAPDVADLDITELVNVRVSPFDVDASRDRGYRASNAVSASRLDTPIGDLPFAIQAFTETFIQDQKPRRLFDVARYSPGVTYRSNDFNEGDANLAIRGFAVSGVPGAVQVLRDGFHGPSVLDLNDAARVEVVKGPSSFLYGQVAPGGVVNVITKSPQPRFAATGELRLGAYGSRGAVADLTGPLQDGLNIRLVASYDQDIHYWKPYDAHQVAVSPSLQWLPTPDLGVTLKFQGLHRRESPQLMQKPGYGRQQGPVPTPADPNRQGEAVPGLPDDWNSMADTDYRNSDAEVASAWADLRAGEHWNLRVGVSHLHEAVDALFTGNFGMANNSTFLQGRRVRRQIYGNSGDTLSFDAVGGYAFAGVSLHTLLGAQWVRRGFDNWAAQAPNDPALGNDPTASPLPLWDLRDPTTWDRSATVPLEALTANPTSRFTRAFDRSIYAGATLGLFDERLLLLGGLRETETDTRLTNRLSGVSSRIEARRTTPQVGALFKPVPGLALFGSWAESFVPGSQILALPEGGSAPAAPTRGRGWDAGFKLDMPERHLSGTFTVFDLRNRGVVNDLASTDASGVVSIYNVQSGEQRSRGFEADLTWLPLARWQWYLSYSRMKARITEFSGRDAAILAQDPSTLDAAGRINYQNAFLLHGAPLQMSAPQLANLWTRLDFESGAFVGGGLNVVRDQTLLPDGPPSTRQSYTLVNALAGYAWRRQGLRYALDLSGRNLTDERYRPSQSTRSRPREWLLSLKVSL